MALSIIFDDGDKGIVPCPGTLGCRACGGRGPYIWSVGPAASGITIVTSGSKSERTILTGPTATVNVAGGAYTIQGARGSGVDCAYSNSNVWMEYGCIDQELQVNSCAGGLAGPTCPQINIALACCPPEGGCLIGPNLGTCNTSIYGVHYCTPAFSDDCHALRTLQPRLCDIRSQSQINAGCAPCRVRVNGAILTLTDASGASVSRVLR